MRLGRITCGVLLLMVLWPIEGLSGGSSQDVKVDTQKGYLGVQQGLAEFNIAGLEGEGTVSLNLTNSSIRGLYNTSAGIGSMKNQASVILVNLLPNQYFSPFTSTLQIMNNNQVSLGEYDYISRLQANSLQGSGLVAINLSAGNFNNQFTCVALHFSKGPLNSPNSPVVSSAHLGGTANGEGLVALTNAQLQAVAAASGNIFTELAKGRAMALVEGDGFKDFSGLVAITTLAGHGNQVQNNLQMTINTGR